MPILGYLDPMNTNQVKRSLLAILALMPILAGIGWCMASVLAFIPS